MPTTKRNNRAGRTFVVDEVVELKRRNRSRTLSIAALLASANASKSVASTSYASSFILTTSGSLRIYDSYEDDDVTPVGYTTVSALVQYIRSSGFYSTVLDIPESAFTWYSADSEKPIAEGVSSYTFTETGSYMVTCKYDYPISTLESLATTDETASLNLTYSFSIVYGTLTLYTRSEAETKTDLLSSLDNLTWSPDESAFDEKDGYLWRKVSSDGGETWTYFRMEYADGVGIVSITQYFAISTSKTEIPEAWTTTALTTTASIPYLWTYFEILFTDDSTQTTEPYVASTFSAQTIVQYQYGDSDTIPPTTYQAHKFGGYVMRFGGIILGNSQDDDWQEEVPTLEVNKYLWMRISTDGGISWSYSCISDSNFYISGDTSYQLSARGVVLTETELQLSVVFSAGTTTNMSFTWSITGIDEELVLVGGYTGEESDGDDDEEPGEVEEDQEETEASELDSTASRNIFYDTLEGGTISIYLPPGFSQTSFKVTVAFGTGSGTETSTTINGVVSDYLTNEKLDTVDLRTSFYTDDDGNVVYASSSNLSHFWDEFPTTLADGVSPIVAGDYVLVWFAEYTYNEETGAYEISAQYKTPYIYNGSTWEPYDSTDSEHTYILGNVLQEILNDSDTVPATSALYAFFDSMATNAAWIKYLESTEIHLTDAGKIYGGGYDAEGKNEDEAAGFYLDSNGVFKVTSGEFQNITVTGDSKFNGKVTNDQLETVLSAEEKEADEGFTNTSGISYDSWSATAAFNAISATTKYNHQFVKETCSFGPNLGSGEASTSCAYVMAMSTARKTISSEASFPKTISSWKTLSLTTVESYKNSYSYPVYYRATVTISPKKAFSAHARFYLYDSSGNYKYYYDTNDNNTTRGFYIPPSYTMKACLRADTGSSSRTITISRTVYADLGTNPNLGGTYLYSVGGTSSGTSGSAVTIASATIPNAAKYFDITLLGGGSATNPTIYADDTKLSSSSSFSSGYRYDVSSHHGKTLYVKILPTTKTDGDGDDYYVASTCDAFCGVFTTSFEYGTKQIAFITSGGATASLTCYGESSASDWHSNVYYDNIVGSALHVTQKRTYLSAGGYTSSSKLTRVSGNALIAALAGSATGSLNVSYMMSVSDDYYLAVTTNSGTSTTYQPTLLLISSSGVTVYSSTTSTTISVLSQGVPYTKIAYNLMALSTVQGVYTTNIFPKGDGENNDTGNNLYSIGTSTNKFKDMYLGGELIIGSYALTANRLYKLLNLIGEA